MKKIDIKKISKRYSVRKLNLNDVQMIYTFCKKNTQYYKYCGKELSIELIEKDLEITPPGISLEQKYYVGFWDNDKIVAVMDLVNGYPTYDYVYIGFCVEVIEVTRRKLSKNEKNYVFESALLNILYENSIINAESRFRKMKNILVLKAGNYL